MFTHTYVCDMSYFLQVQILYLLEINSMLRWSPVLPYHQDSTVAKVIAASSVLKCSRAMCISFQPCDNGNSRLWNRREKQTYILIGCLVEGDQVGVETSQSHHGPQCKETDKNLQHSGT